MAQPIYFNPDVAKYKYLEGQAKGATGAAIADGVANMFMAYAQHKEQERQDKIKTQLALVKDFGFKPFGEPFAKSLESAVGSQLFPRDQAGNLVLPKTEQEQQEEEIAKRYPDPQQRQHMWAVAHKLEKPDPSPLEVQMRQDIEDRRDRRQAERDAAANLRARVAAQSRVDAKDRDWHNKPSPLTIYKGTLVPYDQRTLRKDPGAMPLTMGEADFMMKYQKYSTDRRGAQLRNRGQILKNELMTHKMLEAQDDVLEEIGKQAKPFMDIAKFMASKAGQAHPEQTNKLIVGTLTVLLKSKVDKNGARRYTDDQIKSLLQDAGFVDAIKEHTTSWFSHIETATHTSGGLLGAGETTTTTMPPPQAGGSVPLDPESEANAYLGGK